MSKFKKMQLVPVSEDDDNKKKLNEILNILKISTVPYLKKASTLDDRIQKILNLELSDYQKAKLYSNTLIKFLRAKDKLEDVPEKTVETLVASKPQITSPKTAKKRKRNIKRIKTIKRPIRKKVETKSEKEIKSDSDETWKEERVITPESQKSFFHIPENIKISSRAKEIKPTRLGFEKPVTKKVDENLEKLVDLEFDPFAGSNKTSRSPIKSVNIPRQYRQAKQEAISKTKEVLAYEQKKVPPWEEWE